MNTAYHSQRENKIIIYEWGMDEDREQDALALRLQVRMYSIGWKLHRKVLEIC